MPGVDAEAYGQMLGDIYDSITRPHHWEVVLASICQRLRLMQGVLGFYEATSGFPLLRIQHGMQKVWFDRMPEYGLDMADFWGGTEKLLGYPVGELVIHSVAHPGSDPSGNRFAREWCVPQSIVDFAAMTLAGDAAGVGTLVFSSDRILDPASDGPEMNLLRSLSPHLRRALEISRLLDLQTIQIDQLRSTLEALPNGIVLLDAAGLVLYTNSSAAMTIRKNDGMRLESGRLTLRDPVGALALEEAVTAAARGGPMSERSSGIPARSSIGARAMLHVLPLKYGTLRHELDPAAVVAVFMTTELSYATLPQDALRVLYDLTPAEVRVCELIVDGLSLGEIAARLGVATSTARTHLLRIFEKTGTNRQADLVRLVASLLIARAPAQI